MSVRRWPGVSRGSDNRVIWEKCHLQGSILHKGTEKFKVIMFYATLLFIFISISLSCLPKSSVVRRHGQTKAPRVIDSRGQKHEEFSNRSALQKRLAVIRSPSKASHQSGWDIEMSCCDRLLCMNTGTYIRTVYKTLEERKESAEGKLLLFIVIWTTLCLQSWQETGVPYYTRILSSQVYIKHSQEHFSVSNSMWKELREPGAMTEMTRTPAAGGLNPGPSWCNLSDPFRLE